MAKADLHVHTIMSDGANTIDELIPMCKARGVDTLAITDHDTIGAFENFKDNYDINIIKGIEFSTTYKNKSVHILGYFIDNKNEGLNNKLTYLRNKRKNRAREIIEKLNNKENIIINYDDIKKDTDDASIGRMHIAREMVRLKYVKNTEEAFIKYIGDDMPCFVKNEKVTIPEAIELIKNAGGISFLAHPGLIKDVNDYNEILDYGLNGIEVFYPKHSNEQRQYFYNLAIERNLLISGGSDFHGLKTKGKNKIASAYLTDKYLYKIINFHKNMTK